MTTKIQIENLNNLKKLKNILKRETKLDGDWLWKVKTATANKEVLVWKMARHHTDLILCRKQPGVALGKVCEKCEGRCVICDSFVRLQEVVRVCDEHNYGSLQ